MANIFIVASPIINTVLILGMSYRFYKIGESAYLYIKNTAQKDSQKLIKTSEYIITIVSMKMKNE